MGHKMRAAMRPREYTIRVRGLTPPDIAGKIAQAHTAALRAQGSGRFVKGAVQMLVAAQDQTVGNPPYKMAPGGQG